MILNKKICFMRINPWIGLIFLLAIGITSPVLANGLTISNPEVGTQDTTNDTLVIEFDITWDNSWRDGINYDAAWIFIKYSTDSGLTWNHVALNASGLNPTGFSSGTGTGADLLVSADKMGCFLQRNGPGSGTITQSNVQLLWKYGGTGISDDNAPYTEFRVYGIEMTYVPEGGFYAGDGNDTGAQFEYGSAGSVPIAIVSEEGFTFTNATTGNYYYNSNSNTGESASGATFQLPTQFPKGYKAFYAMKYEITQGQYVDFLNTLNTYKAQKNRVATNLDTNPIANKYVMANSSTITNHQTLEVENTSPGSALPIFFKTTRADRGLNNLSYMDLAAYADWAALRPMTELEYEKLCRGPVYPVSGEYAWGTTTLVQVTGFAMPESTGTETLSTPGQNAVYGSYMYPSGDAGKGPIRVGAIAASNSGYSGGRVYAGGGYYGNMELTGNVYERIVTVGNTTGRAFGGSHGDGTLETASGYEGNATNADWPGYSGGSGVNGATGTGLKGGSWSTSTGSPDPLSVSARTRAAEISITRDAETGGRLVRTASA